MRARPPIIWHRFAAEIFDPEILRHFHELHAEYREMIRVKQSMRPFIASKPDNLTTFVMHIIQTGIEAVAREIQSGGDNT
jgi:hypothetical protein